MIIFIINLIFPTMVVFGTIKLIKTIIKQEKELEKYKEESIASIKIIREHTSPNNPMSSPLALSIRAVCNREISRLENLSK